MPDPSPATRAEAPTPALLKKVTDRPPNPKGTVFIVEYHHIGQGTGDYYRSPKQFRIDLQRLYDRGFRPCTVSDYLAGRFSMPSGATPVALTFDDSHPDNLRLLPDGSVDPNCAVGIWMDFAKTHPDFPVRGTFYVLPKIFFGQPKMRRAKVKLLLSMGCEIGTHTMSHPRLRRLSDTQVKREIALSIDRLAAYGVPKPMTLAFPYGSTPKNPALSKAFRFRGRKYFVKAGVLAGANPAPISGDPRFVRSKIPRIQAYGGPMGLAYWLKKTDEGHLRLHVTE